MEPANPEGSVNLEKQDSAVGAENEKQPDLNREAKEQDLELERKAAMILENPSDGSFISALHAFIVFVKDLAKDPENK